MRWHPLSVPVSLSSLLGSGIRHCILWVGLELKLSEKWVWGPQQPGWLQRLWELAGAGGAVKVWKALSILFLWDFELHVGGPSRLHLALWQVEARSCPGCLGRKAERRVRVEACEQDGQSDALGGEVVLADLSGSFSLKLKACFLCVQLLHNVSAGGGGPQL
jgi:hypothetical protein